MSAKEASKSVVKIAQTTSSNDAIVASSKSILMSPSESTSDGTLTKKQKRSIVKLILMCVIMPLKRVVTYENFSYVVIKNRVSNRRDLNSMFRPINYSGDGRCCTVLIAHAFIFLMADVACDVIILHMRMADVAHD